LLLEYGRKSWMHQPRESAEKFTGGSQRKKDRKIAKKYRKIALLYLFQGRGATEKRPKKAKKDRKIALLILYLLNLYHV